MNRAEPPRGKVLGRGLSSLIGGNAAVSPPTENRAFNQPADSELSIVEITLDDIQSGTYQPRKSFDDRSLEQLAASIREVGVIQPIVVRPLEGGKYELISGERRWRASRLAGKPTVPALIRPEGDAEALQVSLIENVQRENLNPVERAQAYRLFCDTFELTAEQVAQKSGEDRSTVTNYLRLLELPEPVLAMLKAERITMGHARALLKLPTDEDKQRLAIAVVEEGLSVRAVEDRARLLKEPVDAERADGADPSSDDSPLKSATVRDLEARIASRLGLKVSLSMSRRKGHGSLSIRFSSLDQFDELMRTLDVPMDDD